MRFTKPPLMLAIVVALATPYVSSEPATEPVAKAEAELKKYNNDAFGFAFDYPASWTVVEKPGDSLLSLKLLSEEENLPIARDYSPGSVSVDVFANPEKQQVREWLDKHGWPFDAAGRSVMKTSVGGQPALEVATGKMFAPNRFTYVATNDLILRLSFLAPGAEAVRQSFRFERK